MIPPEAFQKVQTQRKESLSGGGFIHRSLLEQICQFPMEDLDLKTDKP